MLVPLGGFFFMTPRLLSAQGIFTRDTCHILPCISVTAMRCENPLCQEIHGFGIHIQWLWWAVVIHAGPHMIEE